MVNTWKDGVLLKIVNVIVYFLLLGSNIYTGVAPVWSPYSGGKETYITPAPWAFFIRSLLRVLLLGTIIYQFTPGGKRTVIDGISWRFPILGVLSTIYIHLCASHRYILAFIFALCVSSVVTHIYYIVKKYHAPQSLADEIFVHSPFSLYHAWTTILVILTGFEAFGANASNQPAGLWTKVFVFLGLFFLELTAFLYAFSTPEGDLPASVAIALSLWAIFAHQKSSGFIRWSALTFSILSLLWVAKGAFGLYRRSRSGHIVLLDDEVRAPLINTTPTQRILRQRNPRKPRFFSSIRSRFRRHSRVRKSSWDEMYSEHSRSLR